MKHKSIINILSVFFCICVLFSPLSIVVQFTAKLEIIFSFTFIFIIILCIVFFKIADYLEKRHKENKLINVINHDLYICKNMSHYRKEIS